MAGVAWRSLGTLRGLLRRDNYRTGASLQETADLLRLYLLTGAREAWPHPEAPPSLEDLPPASDQRTLVHSRLALQGVTLLDAWNRERPPALPPESPDAPITDERRAELQAERVVTVAAAQQRAFGFEVHVAPSSAGATAGDGVFLKGSTPPGSLVVFYPGVSMEPADVLTLPGGTRAFEGNEYLMARFDKTIIDGSARSLALLPPEALECPLSIAHTVNHPPGGTLPNVVPAPIDWPHGMMEDLIRLVPNVSYQHSTAAQRLLLTSGSNERRPRDLLDLFRASLAEGVREADPEEGPVLKGLALVTTREVRDEELFLNYRLNPRNGYPSWYSPVDQEEDARRWT